MHPLKQPTHISTANTRINELKAQIGGFEWSVLVHDVTIKICPLASTLLELDNPNGFYHDDIHLNYNLGVPILNKTRTSKVGAISKAQKAQKKFFLEKNMNF